MPTFVRIPRSTRRMPLSPVLIVAFGIGGASWAQTATQAQLSPPAVRTTALDTTAPLQLPPVSVDAQRQTADTPALGYVAERDRAGTKTDTPLLETPQSVSVITRDQMVQQGAHTLNQAMRYSAGVAPETRGGGATRYDLLTIRGFSADTYLNGLKLLDNQEYSAPQIDPYLLDRIDVLKGPASILYGSAQAGGLINQVSKMPTEIPLRELGFRFGNFTHLQSTFDFGGSIDKDGQWLYRVTGIGFRENGQVSGTLSERITIAPALTWKPDADTSLTLLGLYQHDPYGTSYGSIPPQGTVLFNPFGRLPVNFYDGNYNFEKFDRTQVSLGYVFNKRFDDNWTVRMNGRWFHVNLDYASVYANGLDTDYRSLFRGTAASRERSDQVTLDNQVETRATTGPVNHTLLAGFDFQHLDSSRTSGFSTGPSLDIWAPDHNMPIIQPARSDNTVIGNQYGIYLQDQLRLGGFILTLSGREDFINSDQANLTFGTRAQQSANAFTGRAALSYVFESGIAPYISYSESFTPVYGSNAAGEVFKPERGKQYEVGVKYQPPETNALLTAAVFDLTRQNLLTADPVNPGNSVQSGEARSRGVELEARASLARGINLIAAYTYLDTIYTKDNGGHENKHLPAVPNHLVSGWAYYTVPSGLFEGVSFGTGVRYIGPSFSSDNTFKVPGVALVDMAIRYDLGHALPKLRGAELHANASNLLDARYVASCYYGNWCAYGYQRQLFAGLTYRW